MNLSLLFQLTETSVLIRARQADLALIESLFPEIIEGFKNTTHKDISLRLDQENVLSADGCGGVELLAARGKSNLN